MSGVFKSLQPKDIVVTPFMAHKLVVANFDGNESSSYCKVFQAENSLSSSYNFYQQGVTSIDQGNTHPEFEPVFATTTDGYFKTAIHSQIDHLFYRDYITNNKATLGGSGNINFQYRDLGYKAKVISLPNHSIGEGILPGSLVITGSGYTIVDDSAGNLILKTATGLTSPDPCDYDNLMLSYTFNRYYKYANEGPLDTILEATYGSTRLKANFTNMQFERVDSKGSIAAKFSGSLNSIISFLPEDVSFRDTYNFINKDYSFAFRFKINNTPAANAVLLAKQDLREDIGVNLQGYPFTESSVPSQYPYKLEITNAPKLKFTKSNSISTLTLESGTLTPGQEYSCVIQRSGSVIQMYINGALNTSATDPFYTENPCENKSDMLCANDSMLRLGNDYSLSKGFSGNLDYIHIFDRSLTTNEITDVYQTTGSINRFCGNVFYNLGFVVITHPKIVDEPLTRLTVRGSVTLLETEVFCTVGPGEFTTTHNRSVHAWNSATNQFEIGCRYLSSSFRPYVTTIGLYDNSYNLVAVGKLSTPIQTSRTTDTTFVVRFDR